MKKILASILILSCASLPAFAQQKTTKHSTRNCPAATCTDHSYDQAYSAPQTYSRANSDMNWTSTNSRKSCPAASCTDHSYDEAYSADWNNQSRPSARTSRRMDLPKARPTETFAPVPASLRDESYSMSNYTIYGRNSMTAPDPYHGDDAPSYDGAAKNAYRNMRANNDSEPLPANNGQ